VSQPLSNLAFQAVNILGLTESSLLSSDLLTQAGMAQAPIQDQAPDSNFEASPAPSSDHSTPPLLPAIVAGMAAMAPATAVAQTPGVEQLAALAPHLPPTWQMVVGGLLYAEPAIRATSRAIRKIISFFTRAAEPKTPPAKPQTLAQSVNQITGTIERKIGPIRDAAAISLGIYTGAKILFGDAQIVEHIPAAIAAGLSLWNYNDRTSRIEASIVRNQMTTGERLLPSGWRAQEARALGVFAPEVPETFPAEHLIGDQLPAFSKGAFPGFSLWRNIRALGTTISMLTGVMRRSHVYTEGNWKTFKSWLASIRPGSHAPVSEKYLAAVDVMLPQWAMRICEYYGVTLQFKELEKLKGIPKGAPVVFSSFPHSAIYTDFLFWAALSRARFVADKKNFHDHPIVRAIGLAWFLDVIGLPFVSRGKGKRSGGVNSRQSTPPPANSSMPPAAANGSVSHDLYAQTTDRMSRFGIQPVFFGQAGRAPRAYRDDRTLGRPGLYSNVVDPKNPSTYYNLRGTVRTAIAAAKQSGQDAYIPILNIDGSGRVMPKIAKSPPFIQPVQPGEVTFSIGDIIRVSADSNPSEIEHQIIAAAKKATGINEFLQKEVARWADQAGRPSASDDFVAQAEKDETYYIIADRIRSVHPNMSQRNEFRSRLLELAGLAARGESVTGRLQNLLLDVSKIVKETEYQ